jgi:hypothetical protein
VCHNQSLKKLVLFLYGLRSELISLSNGATTVSTSNDRALGGTSMIAATQSPSGYFIRARPWIDRFVKAPSRNRSPFKCISPRPEINLAKAEVVRMKFCIELKDQR